MLILYQLNAIELDLMCDFSQKLFFFFFKRRVPCDLASIKAEVGLAKMW